MQEFSENQTIIDIQQKVTKFYIIEQGQIRIFSDYNEKKKNLKVQ